MELNGYTHTLLALGCMYATYILGRYWENRTKIEKAIGHTLESLEKEGLILTRMDKDGEKDIVPVSEIIAKATRDAIK
jgi:hypothetical protein